ncbi:MAG: hypothetical protein PHW02_01200 [bacterium]|nr:hypothetical protein [bacterium]
MRRIYGLIGLVLIFTNCVTLFHSARVLEPGEYETGGSFTLGGMATQDYEGLMGNERLFIEYRAPSTPPIGLFVRNGWSNGLNTGAYLGLAFIDFFVTKRVIAERNNVPSVALTADFSINSVIFHNEYCAATSLDLFKSKIDDNKNVNPFLKIRGGYKIWSMADILSGSTYSGSLPVVGLIIGNEMKVSETSYLVAAASFETMYGSQSWADGPFSFELNFDLTLSRRSK